MTSSGNRSRVREGCLWQLAEEPAQLLPVSLAAQPRADVQMEYMARLFVPIELCLCGDILFPQKRRHGHAAVRKKVPRRAHQVGGRKSRPNAARHVQRLPADADPSLGRYTSSGFHTPSGPQAMTEPVWNRGAAGCARDGLCTEMKKLVASAVSLTTSWHPRRDSNSLHSA